VTDSEVNNRLGDSIKVVLIKETSEVKNCPSGLERAIEYTLGCPLIFQNIRLPELAPF
jgi:hypothetical protein